MTDNDFDSLLTGSDSPAADHEFKEELMRQSAMTFHRTFVRRRLIRTTAFSLAVLLVAAAAFLGGRWSISSQFLVHQQVALKDLAVSDVLADAPSFINLESVSSEDTEWYGFVDDTGDQYLIEGVRVVPATFN